MSSYLPEKKTYAVCSNQLGSSYSTFVVHPDLRGENNITVSFKGSLYPLLTEKDRKLGEEFSCKTCWSSGAGTIAFGAGVVTGLLIAGTVATVPVVGWVVGGVIALGCLAYGLHTLFSTLTCNQMIEYDESMWIMPHQTTRLDTHLAVVKTSFVLCKEGGMIIPFINETAAKNAASDIGRMNRSDMGINVLGNFLSGGLLGFSLGGGGGAFSFSGAVKSIFLGFTAALFVIQPLLNGLRLVIRTENEAETDNPYYENMNDHREISLIPDLSFTSPGDSQASIDESITALRKIRNLAKEGGATQSQIAEIDAAITAAEANGGSMAGANNPNAKIVFDKAKNGEYGPAVKDQFTNLSGNGKGMNTRGNYDKASDRKRSDLNKIKQDQKIQKATGAIAFITLLLPFFSTALDEKTITTLAEAAQEDSNEDISVVAEKY